MRNKGCCLLVIMCLCIFSGCAIQKDDTEKLREVEFTVVNEREIPEELGEKLEDLKKDSFEITYGDQGYLYIAKGYGQQETTGYSVCVKACYETENTICVKTELDGPPKEEQIMEKATYPYVVIKIEYSDKNIVFD